MRQSNLAIYIESKLPISTDELDRKLRTVFGDGARIFIGVNYKNFTGMSKVSLFNNDGVETSQYELLAKGAEPIIEQMRCIPCNRIWKAGGYKTSNGIFLFKGTEACKSCGNEGERIDTERTLTEMRP